MTNDSNRKDEAAPGTAEVTAETNGNIQPAPGSAAAGEGTSAAGDPVQTSAAELAALKAEIEELKDRVLRAHAEMDNLRKRCEREKTETQKYAVTKFARDILSVGDNFQRAIDAVPARSAEQDPALKSFLEGVTLTERDLINVLERHGVRRMDVQGQIFNPHLHQAMMEMQNAEVPSGTILQVLQAGYMIEDRVLRPAMVVVAKGGPKADASSAAPSNGEAPKAANDDAPSQAEAGGEEKNT